MNDIRRTILWVIFGFSMVMLWDQWQVHNGNKATFFPSPTQQTTPSKSGAPGASAANTEGVPSAAGPATNALAVPTGAVVVPVAPSTPKERIEVSTDVLKLTFETEGGSLVRTEFLKHTDMADKSRNFVLLDDSKDRVYVAQTGVIGVGLAGAFPTHKTPMVVSSARSLKDGENEMTVQFTSGDVGGIKLVKTYTLRRGAYDMAVKHELTNVSAAPLSPQLYLQLVRDGSKPSGESSFYSTFTGPAVYTDGQEVPEGGV
jgi:YidC/Oxa1 family membrane protein insertase